MRKEIGLEGEVLKTGIELSIRLSISLAFLRMETMGTLTRTVDPNYCSASVETNSRIRVTIVAFRVLIYKVG